MPDVLPPRGHTATQYAGYKPRDLCRRWRVGLDKIMVWIRRGELRALDMSSSRSGRPRFVVTAEMVAEFEARRATTPPPKPVRRKKRTDEVDFYPD
jgi:hypothetical protein